MPLQYEIDADFALSIVQILSLQNKFNYFSHIHVEISKFQKCFKSRYRDASRRLRNAVLDECLFNLIFSLGAECNPERSSVFLFKTFNWN